MQRRNQQDSSSGSSTTYSESSTTSSQYSSRSKKPFFEKYAELNPRSGASRAQNNSSYALNQERSPGSPSLSTGWPSNRGRAGNSSREIHKTRVDATPPTSPEISPRKESYARDNLRRQKPNGKLPNSSSMPFSQRSQRGRNGNSNDLKAEISQRLKEAREITGSRSASSGLDRILATRNDPIYSDETLKSSSNPSNSKSSNRTLPSNNPKESSGGGLEDLMGDLMAEMEKKAEKTSLLMKKRPANPQVQIPPASKSSSRDQYPRRTLSTEFDEPREGTPKSSSQSKISSRTIPAPESPGIKPSDSISQWGAARSPSPIEAHDARSATKKFSDHSCQRCGQPATRKRGTVADEKRFCYDCYSELYLPKCRKCAQPIHKGAVTDRVGKVLGKYHASCFNCFQCSAPFPTGDFYVWERKPCSKHYHRLAGTTCCNENCGEGIEGPCVSLILGPSSQSEFSDGSSAISSVVNSANKKLYHPEHFTCARMGCRSSLHEYHFVVNGEPWCERHALEEEGSLNKAENLSRTPQNLQKRNPGPVPVQPRNAYPQPSSRFGPTGPAKRMERRRTIVQNVRAR
ncbi:hypothetical protein BY996DRAFT_2636394 [Phakopsora pachyrhizi]|nr:hypothetical protein BY996DRAFT_2636394 [Phakopsora pachyrhizi]